MLKFIFETTGKLLRATTDVVTDTVNEVIDAPSALIKGYNEGFTMDRKEDVVKVEEPKISKRNVGEFPPKI